MSRRSQLEHEVSVAQERIKKAAKDTPKDIIKLWEQDLVDLAVAVTNPLQNAFIAYPQWKYLCTSSSISSGLPSMSARNVLSS